MFAIPYEKFTLSNGLDLIVHEDHTLPFVSVNVWYHVGSKDEDPGHTGFAHLFEHMMFEGSKNHNRSHFEPLQKVGANLNGSTTSDRTNYWENLPSNHLDLALWLEADRMGFLLDTLDQDRFDVQRDVVKNERRQSYENRPYGMAYLRLQPAVFPVPHPYSWPVIGSQEDLDAAALEDIKDFFRRFYAPSNASLAITGDISIENVRRQVDLYFGDLPPAPPIARVGRMDSELGGEVVLTMRDRVQLPRLYLVWPTCPMFDPNEAPLDLLATVLGDGKSSRLHRKLVYEMQIARDVRVGNYSQEIAGEFQIQVTANPEHGLDEIQEVVETELQRIREAPPEPQELERAKNRIQSDRVRYLERVGGFGGRADQLNHYNVFAGDPGVVNSDIDRYVAVTADDVRRVAATALGVGRVRLEVLPEDALEASTSVVDRTSMPKGEAPRTYSPPVPKRDRLPNGVDVLYIETTGLPLVAVGLHLRAGAMTDPQDSPGLANMTAAMLPEGTATRSSQELSEEMEFLGAQLDVDVGREHVLLGAESLTQHWPKVLEVIADVAKAPTFPPEELERVRRERITDLRRIGDDPVTIARRASRALVYGPDTRYGHPSTGTEQAIEALTRDDLLGHYDRHYGPADCTLVVVGDVTGDVVLEQAAAHLGDWSRDVSPSATNGPADTAPEIGSTIIFLADKPGAAQSVIRAGHLTADRHDPDFYAMTLLNYVFGGQPTARLFMNLREDKGYSYGYYSTMDWATGPSMLQAGGAVQTAVTKESVVETLKEFGDIKSGRPVTQEEYDNARDGIFRGFPAQFETHGSLLHQLARQLTFGLPDDYLSGYIAKLDAVSLAELHRVAGERIDDSRLALLVVGDRQVIEPGLAELGLPIVLVDYEGRPAS